MARLICTWAIVSDDGNWYFTGFRWKPLVANPSTRVPAFRSPEDQQRLDWMMRKGMATNARIVGKRLAQLVAEHGSLAEVERLLARGLIDLVPPDPSFPHVEGLPTGPLSPASAQCETCGARGQVVGRPCEYCETVVA